MYGTSDNERKPSETLYEYIVRTQEPALDWPTKLSDHDYATLLAGLRHAAMMTSRLGNTMSEGTRQEIEALWLRLAASTVYTTPDSAEAQEYWCTLDTRTDQPTTDQPTMLAPWDSDDYVQYVANMYDVPLAQVEALDTYMYYSHVRVSYPTHAVHMRVEQNGPAHLEHVKAYPNC